MSPEDADRLSRLDEQRLVALKALQGRDDALERLPIAGGLSDAPINDQILRPLGDLGIQVVNQPAEGGFRQPDRKSAGEGKSVSVSVVVGVRRIIKKTKQ